MPSAHTTNQWNRLHGRRSSRAGTSVSNTASAAGGWIGVAVIVLLCCDAIGRNRMEAQMDPFLADLELTIARWHGVDAPNEPGRRMAADLIHTIAAFEALRGTLHFEDEPSGFESALHDTREAP
jgi:hypothetical protein